MIKMKRIIKNEKKKYLTVAQLRERYGGVSHMWIERRLKGDPEFPRPVKLGSSLLRMFDLDEIETYERACTATRQHARDGREAEKSPPSRHGLST
jgi:predicted DNA-binding transcriptional regulator AlpA